MIALGSLLPVGIQMYALLYIEKSLMAPDLAHLNFQKSEEIFLNSATMTFLVRTVCFSSYPEYHRKNKKNK